VNTDDQEVTWGRTEIAGFTALNVGSRDRQVLDRSCDNLRIDWGYFHLAVPPSESTTTVASASAIRDFVQAGHLAASDNMDMPRTPHDKAAHLAIILALTCGANRSEAQHILLAYPQDSTIEYLERKLRLWWQRNDRSLGGMLEQAEAQYVWLEARGSEYDRELSSNPKHARLH
jgi:Domain of unknown function (DUF5127)